MHICVPHNFICIDLGEKISHVILFGDESDKARDQRECFDVVIGKTEAMLC
jgi:hypothetical protein